MDKPKSFFEDSKLRKKYGKLNPQPKKRDNPVFYNEKLPYRRFPEGKPGHYKRCRVLLQDNTVLYGYRCDTGFGKEWHLEGENGRLVLKFDEDVKGWWYISEEVVL